MALAIPPSMDAKSVAELIAISPWTPAAALELARRGYVRNFRGVWEKVA